MPGVLLYHRVNVMSSDPWALNVAPLHFAEHLEAIRARAQPIPLADLVQNVSQGLLSDHQVALTFDDGYADNLYEALPALERFDLQATFFVPSQHVGTGPECWWDELDRILLQPGSLPRRLTLNIDDERFQWDLGEACRYTIEDARQHARWVAWEAPPTARHALFLTLWTRCQVLVASARVEVLQQLSEWAALLPVTRPTHRMLDSTEMVKLSRSPSAAVGAHTVSHPSLAALSVSDQRIEILKSKVDLEQTVGPVDAFAYPFGKRSDYSAETLDIVRAAGFVCGCINEPGPLTASTSPFELPRLIVPDLNGHDFERWLSRVLS